MINFEFGSTHDDESDDLEVYNCCGTTCDKAKSITQVTDLQELNDELTAQLAMSILAIYFLGTKLENGVYPDLGGTEDLLGVLVNSGGMDYIKTERVIGYIADFRELWRITFYEH